MLPRIVLFGLAVVLGNLVHAQSFQQHLGGDRAQMGVAAIADGSTITTVVHDASVLNGPIAVRLLTTDQQGGSPAWNTVGTTGSWFAQDAIASGDGALLVCGSFIRAGRSDQDAFIIRVGSNGTVTWNWSTDTPEEEEELLGMDRLANGDIAAAGLHRTNADSDALIVRISSTGELQWLHHYGTTNDERTQAVAQQGDDLVAVGRIMNFGGETDAYILRVDGQGNEIWWQSWGSIHNEDLFDVVRSGEELVMVGYTEGEATNARSNAYLMAFNANGDTLRTRSWSDPQFELSARCIVLAGNGDLLIGGEQMKDRESDAMAIRSTATGSLLWRKGYDLQREDRLDHLFATPDGGFTGTGRCYGPQSGQVLLLRKNGNGE